MAGGPGKRRNRNRMRNMDVARATDEGYIESQGAFVKCAEADCRRSDIQKKGELRMGIPGIECQIG